MVTESCERLNKVLSNMELPCRYLEDSGTEISAEEIRCVFDDN